MFTDGGQVAVPGVFTVSGVDNTAMSTSQPGSIALAGLPSYEDVIAHSDIYVSLSL